MDTKPWDALSQNRPDLIMLTMEVLCLRPTTLRSYVFCQGDGIQRQEITFHWKPSDQAIFSDLFVLDYKARYHETVEVIARRKVSAHFWEEAVCAQFLAADISYHHAGFQRMVHFYQEFFLSTSGLPTGLFWRTRRILPWATQSCNWEGTRDRILRLSSIERLLYPSHLRHQE